MATYHEGKRPRTAVIGFDGPEISTAIGHLVGEVRQATDWRDYTKAYAATETDLVVTLNTFSQAIVESVGAFYLLVVCTANSDTGTYLHGRLGWRVESGTARELSMDPDGPLDTAVRSLIAEASGRPLDALTFFDGALRPLVWNSTGKPVAALYQPMGQTDIDITQPHCLVIPPTRHLMTWVREWLTEIHAHDNVRVPIPPPRIAEPADWFTPAETLIHQRVQELEDKVNRLTAGRDAALRDLAAASAAADSNERRILWSDGEDLVSAVRGILQDLGFTVTDLDAEVRLGEPKGEDLLVQDSSAQPPWSAAVEVKGYKAGMRTNDLQQIRQHRDKRLLSGSATSTTWWIGNPHRTVDPAERPAADKHVNDAAVITGVVALESIRLYQLWRAVQHNQMSAVAARTMLRDAQPGLWTKSVNATTIAEARGEA